MSDHVPGIKKNSPPDTEVELSIKERIEALDDEQLEDAWTVEAQHWAELGLNPAMNIQIDQFHLKFRFDMLFEFVREKLELDVDEFDRRVKQSMLMNMINLRQQHERQLLHARLTQGIQPPVPQMPILPPGTKI